MFTIFYSSIGGREVRRYFKSWDNAKAEMLKSIEDAVNRYKFTIDNIYDYFDKEEGKEVFEYHMTTQNGDVAVYALVLAYFVDTPND